MASRLALRERLEVVLNQKEERKGRAVEYGEGRRDSVSKRTGKDNRFLLLLSFVNYVWLMKKSL